MEKIHSFLWLGNIPLYMYTTSLFSKLMIALGCFHILGIVNSAAVNFVVHVSFQISVFIFPDRCSVVELLCHMLVLFLVFWGPSILLSTVAAPTYIPTNSVQGFPFLHILTNICCMCSFLKSLPHLLQYCFCFMFWFCVQEACGVLYPCPGIKPAPPALESKVLTSGLPGSH